MTRQNYGDFKVLKYSIQNWPLITDHVLPDLAKIHHFESSIPRSWSSLVVGDEGWIGPG